MKSWISVFDSDYEVVLADTNFARRIHYRLRYQVYCLETGLEEADQYFDGEEKDEFDASAVHFLVRLRRTGRWIAAIRLVLPSCRGRLPMELYSHFDPTFRDLVLRKELRLAEVSRLCILGCFRRRATSGAAFDGVRPHEEPASGMRQRCRDWEILVALLRAIVAYCGEHGIEQLVFLISPALGRVLARLKIPFDIIGQPCWHRGLRYPCSAWLQDARCALVQPGLGRGAAPAIRDPVGYRRFSELDYPAPERRPVAESQTPLLLWK